MLNTVGILIALALCFYAARLLYLNLRLEEPQTNAEVAEAGPSSSVSVRRMLKALNIDLEPLLFVAGIVLIAMTICLGFVTLFPTRIGLGVLASLGFLPVSYVLLKDLFLWRARRFENALVDLLDLMVALTASGVAPLRALEAAADGSPPEVKASVAELVARLRMGDRIDTATQSLLETYRSEGVRLFVMALRSRWNDGPHFETLLRALTSALRQRRAYRIHMRGQLSGARYALMFAAGFPYLLIPFFMWREPDWLLPLSEAPAGPSILLAAMGCQVLGLLWMRTIMRTQP